MYSGQGTLYVKLWNVTYDGEFAKGKPATGPIARKLNASFQVPLAPPDPKAKGGAKAAAPVGPENVVPVSDRGRGWLLQAHDVAALLPMLCAALLAVLGPIFSSPSAVYLAPLKPPCVVLQR